MIDVPALQAELQQARAARLAAEEAVCEMEELARLIWLSCRPQWQRLVLSPAGEGRALAA